MGGRPARAPDLPWGAPGEERWWPPLPELLGQSWVWTQNRRGSHLLSRYPGHISLILAKMHTTPKISAGYSPIFCQFQGDKTKDFSKGVSVRGGTRPGLGPRPD